MLFAVRAPSREEEEDESAPDEDAACTSRPDVKARSPAPVRIMLRTAGSWERRVKISRRVSHMLEFCEFRGIEWFLRLV